MERALAAWFLVAAATAGAGSPRDVVQDAVSRVLVIVTERADADRTTRGDAADRRRLELRKVASETFDLDEMARRALSRHWAPRSRAERAEFVELFTDLLERTYLARLESYAGEKISFPNEIIDGHYATVRSRIVSRRRTETSVDYRLHQDHGKWKVFDVSVDGVSFVATYRTEFDRIIQASSYPALLDRLRKRRVEIDALDRQVDRSEPSARR